MQPVSDYHKQSVYSWIFIMGISSLSNLYESLTLKPQAVALPTAVITITIYFLLFTSPAYYSLRNKTSKRIYSVLVLLLTVLAIYGLFEFNGQERTVKFFVDKALSVLVLLPFSFLVLDSLKIKPRVRRVLRRKRKR